MSITIQSQSATLAVLTIRLAKVRKMESIPTALIEDAESGGYIVGLNKAGNLSVRKGSAKIPPSGVASFLEGLATSDNGVRGWKLPNVSDDNGQPITLLTALQSTLGFRVVFTG